MLQNLIVVAGPPAWHHPARLRLSLAPVPNSRVFTTGSEKLTQRVTFAWGDQTRLERTKSMGKVSKA